MKTSIIFSFYLCYTVNLCSLSDIKQQTLWIYSNLWFGFFLFNGILNFVGYLMPKLSL